MSEDEMKVVLDGLRLFKDSPNEDGGLPASEAGFDRRCYQRPVRASR